MADCLNSFPSKTISSASGSAIVDYIEYIKDTCMIFSIENIAAKLQDRISNQKYYFVDNGLLNLFLFDGSTSLLENAVAIYLREKYGDDVFYYNDNVEVDFCLWEHRQAIQVSFSVQDAKTCERETRALVAYSRRFPGCRLMLLTMDEEKDIEVDGCHIEIRPVWKWMLCGMEE